LASQNVLRRIFSGQNPQLASKNVLRLIDDQKSCSGFIAPTRLLPTPLDISDERGRQRASFRVRLVKSGSKSTVGQLECVFIISFISSKVYIFARFLAGPCGRCLPCPTSRPIPLGARLKTAQN